MFCYYQIQRRALGCSIKHKNTSIPFSNYALNLLWPWHFTCYKGNDQIPRTTWCYINLKSLQSLGFISLTYGWEGSGVWTDLLMPSASKPYGEERTVRAHYQDGEYSEYATLEDGENSNKEIINAHKWPRHPSFRT